MSNLPATSQRMIPGQRETFPLVTLGQIRGHGCRNLLVYCESLWCNHSAVMNADALPDEMPVRSLCPRMVCTADRSRCATGLVASYEQAAVVIGPARPGLSSGPLRCVGRILPTNQRISNELRHQWTRSRLDCITPNAGWAPTPRLF
jgi:hypothetical protein